jgi:hypothetical protein
MPVVARSKNISDPHGAPRLWLLRMPWQFSGENASYEGPHNVSSVQCLANRPEATLVQKFPDGLHAQDID